MPAIESPPRRRVLIFAEGVTLAHVGRSIALASILRRVGIDVELACDPRYSRFLARLDFPVLTIRSIPSEMFLEALVRGRPVFSTQTLAAYVREDLSLIEKSKPDAVIGDFRLSLSVSARVAGVPYVNVTNAYWSPYARPRFRMPGLPAAHFLGETLGHALFSFVRPLAFAAHALPMNRVRHAYGLPMLGRDVRRIYCDGDLTLYADLPELVPTFDAPPSHRYIGPVPWSPAVSTPSWWDEATGGEPPIYVSLGSSGPAKLLPMAIDALTALGRPIVVATAGRPAELPKRARVWVADFVSGEAMAAKACVFVCNGGSPTTHQALLRGIPVVGIADNLDQYLNMHYVERFGAGILLRADRVRAEEARTATRRAIEDGSMRQSALTIAELAARTRPEVEFPSAIRFLLGLAQSAAALTA